MNDRNKIKELIQILNQASYSYYNATPIMSDYEWDKLYDELQKLEAITEIIYPNSPTQTVGYKVLDSIEDVTHNHPMLSLDKSHSEKELIRFAKDKECVLSVKADGLTVSLRYINGELVSAETRGNGVVGSNVLGNVLNITNVPRKIHYKDELIVDGEVIIDWKSFNRINNSLEKGQSKYKHPRNLVSGTITILDTKIAASRGMRFIAWRVIKGIGQKSLFDDLKSIEKLGFEVIPMWKYSNNSCKENLTNMLNELQKVADRNSIPYDGAVMAYDDIQYGTSLGRTNKFFRHSIAYKYEDELYETTLKNVEWSVSKTGLINPVAIFDEVLIDGASITRATLHNLSYIEKLQLGIGDKIQIYKANKIIPKVHNNITKSDNLIYPKTCPICKEKTIIIHKNDSKVLYCSNPNCKAKLLAKLSHFVSRDAMNIEGLSEQTLKKFINLGWLNSIKDIYHLSNYRDEIELLDGFGFKSVNKLLNNIEQSRNCALSNFIYALSIPLIGKTVSRDISKACSNGNVQQFIAVLSLEEKPFIELNGFGEEMCSSLKYWWMHNKEMFYELIEEVSFVESKIENNLIDDKLKNKTFVVTGDVHIYKNRKELQNIIENLGGKVTTSVSAKTNYLINNDINSSSSKNKKAKELGIPIISEEDFEEMIK